MKYTVGFIIGCRQRLTLKTWLRVRLGAFSADSCCEQIARIKFTKAKWSLLKHSCSRGITECSQGTIEVHSFRQRQRDSASRVFFIPGQCGSKWREKWSWYKAKTRGTSGKWKSRRETSKRTTKTEQKYLDSLYTCLEDNVSPTQLIRATEGMAWHGRQRCQRRHGTLRRKSTVEST